jgi:DNA (cytosine-5)-methyltransferase 1
LALRGFRFSIVEMSIMNTAVSLFAGAGGLDAGLEQAGWRILAQVEMDEDCASTLERNANARRGPSRPLILNARVEDISPSEVRKDLGLRRGELALLAGGPPCQPFTTAGLRGAMCDRRAESTFPNWLEWVREFRPRATLMENVDGLLSCASRHRPLDRRTRNHPPLRHEEMKGSFLEWLLGELVEVGYTVTWGVVEAADYGVPQFRQRACLIGVRADAPCYLPGPTHGLPGLPRHRTLRAAIGRLRNIGPVQPLSQFKKDVFRQVPPGGNWRDLPLEVQRATMGAAFHATGGKNGWWRRLSWDKPSPTILGMPDHSSTGLIHPDEVRCLSTRECAAIQTFLASYTFEGSPRSQYQQIGNAVPVRLGRALGEHVINFLAGRRQERPRAPEWRQLSANRRIGTYGWVLRGRFGRQPDYELIVKIRDDHVWAATSRQLELYPVVGNERGKAGGRVRVGA